MIKKNWIELTAIAVVILAVSCAKPNGPSTNNGPDFDVGSLSAHAGTNALVADSITADSVIDMISSSSTWVTSMGKQQTVRQVDTSYTKQTTIPGISGFAVYHDSGTFKGTINEWTSQYDSSLMSITTSGTRTRFATATFHDFSVDSLLFIGGEIHVSMITSIQDSANGNQSISMISAFKFDGRFLGTLSRNQTTTVTMASGRLLYATTVVYALSSGGKTFKKRTNSFY